MASCKLKGELANVPTAVRYSLESGVSDVRAFAEVERVHALR